MAIDKGQATYHWAQEAQKNGQALHEFRAGLMPAEELALWNYLKHTEYLFESLGYQPSRTMRWLRGK